MKWNDQTLDILSCGFYQRAYLFHSSFVVYLVPVENEEPLGVRHLKHFLTEFCMPLAVARSFFFKSDAFLKSMDRILDLLDRSVRRSRIEDDHPIDVLYC